jgi:hypothetical protein
VKPNSLKFSSPARLEVILSLILLSSSPAPAATIIGNISAVDEYEPGYDLSTGTSDWVVYGGVGALGSVADKTSKFGISDSFGNLTSSLGGINPMGFNGRLKVTYTGGLGSYAGNVNQADAAPVVSQSSTAPNLSFTHTLLSGSETVEIFVFNFNGKGDLSASLNLGGSYSLLNTSLFQSESSSEIFLGI